jgi:sugar lactone lactonase YvrE
MPAAKILLVAVSLLSVAGPARLLSAAPGDVAPSPSQGDDAGGAGRAPLPSVIQLPAGFQPEGITRGRGTTLFVAGIANGGIYAADARTGEGEFLVPPQTNGRKAVGLKFQRGTNRLVVAGGDTGQAYIYDADSGESLAELQLADPPASMANPSFVNDVVLTREAAFFTDSFRSVLYRVDLGCGSRGGRGCRGRLPDNDDVTLIPLGGAYEAFPGFNANGIEVTPRGELLIVNGNELSGKLFRVDPRSGEATAIDLGGDLVVNGDGLVLRGRTLFVVENFSNRVAEVQLSRRFDRGELVGVIENDGFDIPATAAFFAGALYVTNARFSTPPTPDTLYTVVRVPID